MKRALITGITGQDGSYLAELLLAKGYEVHGIVHRVAHAGDVLDADLVLDRPDRVWEPPADGRERLHLHWGDLNDGIGLMRLVAEVAPTEIYNLGAVSHVQVSFEMPENTSSTNVGGTVRLLEAVRTAGIDCRYYQASTSDMFGLTPPPQNERSTFHPRSPYGITKLSSHWMTAHYRTAFDMYAVCGILFNHESPRRWENFVARKISKGVARIKLGLQDELVLGNLDAVRDWGYAPEYVEGMWLMLQHERPEDFVLATGTGTTVREFVATAFRHVGLDWEKYVRTDPRFVRPAEVHALIGDASKAQRELGWKAQTHAEDLARIMVDADLALLGV